MTSAQAVEKRTRAVEMVLGGKSYDEIAAALGYANRSGAWKAVQKALSVHEAASVDLLRALEVDRLDALQDSLWEKAMAGDLQAMGLIVRIIMQRSRLLGLIPASSSRKQGRKQEHGEGLISPEFWDHARDDHSGDWQACQCNYSPGVGYFSGEEAEGH